MPVTYEVYCPKCDRILDTHPDKKSAWVLASNHQSETTHRTIVLASVTKYPLPAKECTMR